MPRWVGGWWTSWLRCSSENGQEQWVLVHVEVQTQPAFGFPERMFVYHYRIRDRFGARCATFGVLADSDPSWRPAEFPDEAAGTELVLRFLAKLLDYEADLAGAGGRDQPLCPGGDSAAGVRATAAGLRPAGLEIWADPPFVRTRATSVNRSTACIVSLIG
ncbi:hypothetical protein [Candidatus Amarolinea dominans]|uniref:hypothetical protein n=1 Tax=Candidatus Amarolinea dominans TaxID=3140696 RepID=UPI0031376445|nr:hypothetical protein [Anaerolineae bacterium]